MMPLVSVVIPTRDRRGPLALALRSVLAQRDVDFEVVVVDDGSRDGTSELISQLGDPRVRVLRNASPKGESGARNLGIAAAAGVWIAFLDDDDVWAPDKLIRQLQAVSETGREWAYAGEVMIDRELRILHGAPPPTPGEVMAALPRHNAVPAGASNVIASSKALSAAGPFHPDLRRTADWDMWLRLARIGPPAAVRHPLVAIRVHPGNMSRDMAIMFGELRVLARRHRIPVDRARHYRWAAWGAIQAQQRWKAVRYYAGAVAAGDFLSIARAAFAVARPPRAPAAADQKDPWIVEARAWIDQLAQTAAGSGLHRAHRDD